MLNRIINEIKKSIENECFISALALALTLPDICGKAEYPDEKTTKRYINWYDTYIGELEKPSNPYGTDMPYSSGEVIYSLRNMLLHQGTPNIELGKIHEERCKIDRFILTISDVSDAGTSMVSYIGASTVIHERSLEVNIVNLCSKICRVAKKYFDENIDKFDFFKYEIKDIRHAYDKVI